MERGDGSQSQSYRRSTTTPRTLRKVTPLFVERQRSVPRLGDIWVPKSAVSPNHFTRFYIPGVEDLFQIGDHLVRMEHGRSRARVISWRIWRDSEGKWQFQQESIDEQSFSILPSNFAPLRSIVKGDQSEFAD
jgi:hypothetical protein